MVRYGYPIEGNWMESAMVMHSRSKKSLMNAMEAKEARELNKLDGKTLITTVGYFLLISLGQNSSFRYYFDLFLHFLWNFHGIMGELYRKYICDRTTVVQYYFLAWQALFVISNLVSRIFY